jgi:hypothetical protein
MHICMTDGLLYQMAIEAVLLNGQCACGQYSVFGIHNCYLPIECTHSRTRKKRAELWQYYGISGQHQTDHHSELENEIIIRKIEQAAVGLPEYVSKQLTGLFQLSLGNALNIIDFILTQKREVNISDTYRLNTISTLVLLSKFLNHKAFIDMKPEDILLYLDSLRKQEAFDPLHKWVGSYNVKRQRFIKFFRWLYNPDKIPSARQTPEFIEQIRSLKRKEQSIYKPTDLWTNEDDLLFLKFCPSKRDKCYHAVSRDASGRPHEILGIKLRSVVFKVTADNKQMLKFS